jgi:hypothetical protein
LPGDFSIIAAPAAWANLVTLRASTIQSPQFYELDGIYRYLGIPMWPVAGATNFGAAGLECLFIVNKDNYAIQFEEPKIHGDGWIAASDGFYKLILECPYVHGVILDDYMASILNPAS